MSSFVSLEAVLDGWFESTFAGLPQELALTVASEFMPFSWDELAPDQRREVARQSDNKHDPALEDERQRAWSLVSELDELRARVERWEAVLAPTAIDLQAKEARVAELRAAIDRLRLKLGERPPRARAAPPDVSRAPTNQRDTYIAYPAALAHLRHRLKATPEEMAAWIFMGPKEGGLAAYYQAGELDPPPRFFFPSGEPSRIGCDHQYVPMMMGCWFGRQDIEQFEPKDRYMLGRDLMERWSRVPGIDVVAYMRAKIEEFRLVDLHPVYGGTRISTDDDDYPSAELALFRVADIEAIEAADFGGLSGAADAETPEGRRARLVRRRDQLRASGIRNFNQMLAEEERVSVERIKQLLKAKAPSFPPAQPATWLSPFQKGSPTSRRQKRPG